MKRLVIVRHGEYGAMDHLNDNGKKQITQLTANPRLQKTEKVTIFSSPARRAKESAEILGIFFGVKAEEHAGLYDDSLPAFERTLNLIRSKKDEVDTVILVTHLEYTKFFPSYFAKMELGVSSFPPEKSVSYGRAWEIDCEHKTLTLL